VLALYRMIRDRKGAWTRCGRPQESG